MEKKILKLKRHETFSIREGWLEKGINIIYDEPWCFKKDEGPSYFGLGSNMCKSLKYWLDACGIAEFSAQTGAKLTQFGGLLKKYDPYLDDIFSWWMIHYNLVSNFDKAPVLNVFFNMEYNVVEKEFLLVKMREIFEKDYILGALSSLESDIMMTFKSYYSDDNSNPEENLNCPLGKLMLIDLIDKKTYEKKSPSYENLNFRVVYYALINCLISSNKNVNSFNLEDIYELENNPIKLFNISKSTFMLYLEDMKKEKYINFIKTAGLNTVTIEKIKPIEDLFSAYFSEE